MLKKVGYNPNNVTFVPISAIRSINVYENWSDRPTNDSYNGFEYSYGFEHLNGSPTLIEAMDTLRKPKPKGFDDKPLRISVENTFRIYGVGVVAVGRIETGRYTPFMVINLCTDTFTVKTKNAEYPPYD